jgi:uracil-DNA glycosylase
VKALRARVSPRGGEAAEVPATRSLPVLAAAAHGCQACPLWKGATQTVFGEGRAHAPLLFVGEQPGDQEDRQGHPFVGPAGKLLSAALAAAGIDRRQAYVTNAVKHFKWVPAGERSKRRIHQKPNAREIAACRPWLLAEIEAVQPQVIVCLGATAAQSLLGRGFRVTQHRGEPVPSPFAARVVPTVHPSSILRARDDDTRQRELRAFVDDLRAAAALLSAARPELRP